MLGKWLQTSYSPHLLLIHRSDERILWHSERTSQVQQVDFQMNQNVSSTYSIEMNAVEESLVSNYSLNG